MYITSYSIRIVLLSRYVNIYDTMAPMSGAHNTHNISDCNRYKADGTPTKKYGAKSGFSKKGKDRKDKSYKGGRDKQTISHLTAKLDSLEKKYKKLKKSHGKKRK